MHDGLYWSVFLHMKVNEFADLTTSELFLAPFVFVKPCDRLLCCLTRPCTFCCMAQDVGFKSFGSVSPHGHQSALTVSGHRAAYARCATARAPERYKYTCCSGDVFVRENVGHDGDARARTVRTLNLPRFLPHV